MKHYFIRATLILTFILCAINSNARNKSEVWTNPTVEHNHNCHDGYFFKLLEVTGVELGKNETLIHLRAAFRSDSDFDFGPETTITADGITYQAISADGIDINKGLTQVPDDEKSFTLHFPPLPDGTSEFDLFNAPNFYLGGISNGDATRAQLIPSTWLDKKTGDWLLGLFDEGVIYDSKFWEYVDGKPSENGKPVQITDGIETLSISAGKLKNGQRKFKIGDKKLNLTVFSDRTLPPYPIQDSRENFKTGSDSVTINGWLKDRPSDILKRGNRYRVGYHDIVCDEAVDKYATIDSLGRFSIKIALPYSAETHLDWNKTYVKSIIEPGKSYFLLYDYKTGQTLFMGEDSRLQNEMVRHPIPWFDIDMEQYKGVSADTIFNDICSERNRLIAKYDKLCTDAPSLSARYRKYLPEHIMLNQAQSIGQMRFYTLDMDIPDSICQYVFDNILTKLPEQITLHRETPLFLQDFIYVINVGWANDFNAEAKTIKIPYSKDEQAIVDRFEEYIQWFTHELDALDTDSLKNEFRQKMMPQSQEMILPYLQVTTGDNYNRAIGPVRFAHQNRRGLTILDSIGVQQQVKDLWVARRAIALMIGARHSLTDQLIDDIRNTIKTDYILQRVIAEQDKFRAFEKEIAGRVDIIADNQQFADMTDASEILAKILAPHKGKIVLIDFWGSWCGPCRDALVHSQELYKRLEDYDMVYIYLAYNTGKETQRSIIEEYNIKGDNVFHYNLPAIQQSMVQSLLDISAFPSYRVVDRDGNILDIDANPHQPGVLEAILDKLK